MCHNGKEDDIINLYAEIISNIFFGIIVIRAMGIFFEKRSTPLLITILSYLFAFILTSVQVFWIDSIFRIGILYMLNILINMVVLFIISLNYESSMIKRLATISSINFLFVTVNQLLNLLPLSYVDDLVGTEVLPFISKIPIFLVVSLFRMSFKDIKKSTTDLPMFWVPVLIITAALNFADIFKVLNLDQIANFLIATILLVTSFISFYLYNTLSKVYEDKLKSEVNSQEREYYFSQCQMMQDSVERMKSFRHDIKSHFAALKDFTVGNKAATDYLNELIEDIDKSEIYSDTGNLAFDSIINYKLRKAKKDNIKLDIRMFIPPVLNVEVFDVITIMGNLLDNALEAVEKIDEKTLKLIVKFDKSGLFIKIENSFNGEIEYDEKTGEDKQLVSLKSGTEHGYGLKNIRQSIEKYNGYMKITHTNNVFSVVVFIYVEDKSC
ncbi:MAG: GHKL domain-containing protein [Oscillospiraceae bacterium]|nr:GHKL domain-containing protein [Oscillospiraceae bacterium]